MPEAFLTNNSRNQAKRHPADAEFAADKAPFFSQGAAVFFGRNPKKMGAQLPAPHSARIPYAPWAKKGEISMGFFDKLKKITTNLFSGFTEADETLVTFRTLTEAEIAAYVATGEPMDKAGAYGIQGKGGSLVAGYNGEFDTVVGFNMTLLRKLMSEAVGDVSALLEGNDD